MRKLLVFAQAAKQDGHAPVKKIQCTQCTPI